jgi:hypothetical protein
MSTAHWMTNILIFIELVSFITGLIYWRKVKNTIWIWFTVYLGLIFCLELICNYLHYYSSYKYDVNKIYNYFILPTEFFFLFWLYYQHAKSIRSKLLIITCSFIYICSFIADQYFFQGKKFIFDSFSYCIGNLLLLLVILSFFIQFSKGDEILHYNLSMIFWVSLGVIVFYLGTLPYFGLIHLLYEKHRSIFKYYTYLMFAFNWLMYLLFIIGFIKWKPK